MGDSFDVIMAACQSTGQAERDFETLVRLVKDKTVRSEGVILVEHDADGQVRVSQTGDHLGRRGLGWGGGVGLVVGLFSPPLLASVVMEDKPQPGTGGTVTLWANGRLVGEGKMPHTVPVAFSSYADMDIGRDNGLVVDRAYENKAPHPFTGTVKKVSRSERT